MAGERLSASTSAREPKGSRSPWTMSAGQARRLKVRRAQLVGLVRRVEGIAQADEARDLARGAQLVGDEARHPSAHRLAADQRRRAAWSAGHGSAVFVHEALGPGHAPPRSGLAAARHVGELEPEHDNDALAQQSGNGLQKRRSNASTGPVGTQEARAGVGRACRQIACDTRRLHLSGALRRVIGNRSRAALHLSS